jgi:NADP-dependent 3-hydroxy acid dehydrogenase YdfG
MEFTGQTALVTGASTGIGAVFAQELAARGVNLILVARRGDALKAMAEEITTGHGVRVDVLPADLAEPGAGEKLAGRVAELGRTVDVLVNNAGFATHGDVAAADPARLGDQVQLNCAAVVDLTARFLPAMTARGSGAIINVASTAAFQPVAHMAVYAATKAFVLSFTEALWGRPARPVSRCSRSAPARPTRPSSTPPAMTPPSVRGGGLRTWSRPPCVRWPRAGPRWWTAPRTRCWRPSGGSCRVEPPSTSPSGPCARRPAETTSPRFPLASAPHPVHVQGVGHDHHHHLRPHLRCPASRSP